jgi:hypothetical protein
MSTEISQNIPKYSCDLCNIKTNNKKDFNKHLLTSKHKDIHDFNDLSTNSTVFSQKIPPLLICPTCNKQYKERTGLWKHKQKCNIKHEVDKKKEPNDLINNELVITLLKQNNELQSQILEICKNGTMNNNVVNSHNKAFNLNVFLNETCKDAMDINDFIDSVKLQLSDLELVGKLGFVDGISSIIIKNLKALKVNERPVHCTDLKRETMYVKEQGIWEKQEGDYKNLRKVIKRVAFKNSKNLSLYKELHPDYNDYYSKHSDHYLKLQIEAFGGSGNETIDNENKIIKKIAKEMAIDKT